MNLIHRIEPVLWLLFGAGAFLAAMLLPAVLLGLFILAPLGAFDPEATSHARMVGLRACAGGAGHFITAEEELWQCWQFPGLCIGLSGFLSLCL